MSGLRTFLILLICLPLPGHAIEKSLVSAYASCAGRFSAELEHAWLMNDNQTAEIERRRRYFIDLVSATVSLDDRGQTLNQRISAKVAHASLLTQKTFSRDPARARWAIQRAESEIAYCASFMLES